MPIVLRCYSDLIEAEAGDTAAPRRPRQPGPLQSRRNPRHPREKRRALLPAALEIDQRFLPRPRRTNPRPQPQQAMSSSTNRLLNLSPSCQPATSPKPQTPEEQSRPLRPQIATTLFFSPPAKLPALESAFAHGWPPDARIVLPSYSPQTTAVIVWAPVVAWCLLRAFADIAPARRKPRRDFRSSLSAFRAR